MLTWDSRVREFFEIESSAGRYAVVIDKESIAARMAKGSDHVMLIDNRVADRRADCIAGVSPTRIIRIEADEASKSLENLPVVFGQLRGAGANRRSHLIAVGGGVVQDIATFVASTFMRGIRWSYFPTTLLGMVDSCIGGKSSINVLGHKNLLGNFYPPAEVAIDIGFANSLDNVQIAAGLCESLKICYARGFEEFERHVALVNAHRSDDSILTRIVSQSLHAKKWFIERDEFDKGERLLLNFGHTFGHALESATDFAVPHGIAVGFGVQCAVDHAQNADWLNTDGRRRTQTLVRQVDDVLRLANAGNMGPGSAGLRQTDLDRLLAAFDSDKKHGTDDYFVIVPASDGALERRPISRDAQGRRSIAATFERFLRRMA